MDLAPRIGEIARLVLGPENRRLSTATQLRFGTNGSVSVEIADPERGAWFDHEHNIGGGPLDLIRVKLGKVDGEASEWLLNNLGIGEEKKSNNEIVAVYDYRDESGKLLFQVCRKAPKDFRQRRPDGKDRWIWSTKGTQRVPYRLPELLAAVAAGETIHIAEGEKAVEALRKAGLAATCSPGGAGKWPPEQFHQYFRGADVVVLPDNDDAGRSHGNDVVCDLLGIARVRVLDLAKHHENFPPKADPFDWFALGRTVEDLSWILEGVEPLGATMSAEAVGPSEQKGTSPGCIRATPYNWVIPSALPQREWVYGRHLIRRFISADIAPGGLGKSSLVITETMAMVTGRPLLGDRPVGKLRVWLVNLEDPRDELDRRVAATALHYGITRDDIGDRLFVDSGRDAEMVIAIDSREGVKIAKPIVDAIRTEITEKQIDVMIVDPFVASHAVPENDNGKIAAVARQWASIAEETGCAIGLVHHARKASPGQSLGVDDARGASALVNAARSVRVLNQMTEKEAENAGIDDNPRSYFSLSNGKANLAPPSEKATWRKFVSVPLGNGPAHDPDGDRIGVVEAWAWPNPFDNVSVSDLKEVQQRIAQGEFRADQRSDTWAGKVVAEVLGFNLSDKAARASVKTMLKTWVQTDALREVTRLDAERHSRTFIEVGRLLP
jgi:hypothetical protein